MANRLITEEELESSRSLRGGWTANQFELIGVDWPPLSGWKKEILKTPIPEDNIVRFISLRGV